MPCVSMPEQDRLKLVHLVEADPSTEIKIDLLELKVCAGDLALDLDIREGARDSLINGRWDPLEELLDASSDIERVSRSIQYT